MDSRISGFLKSLEISEYPKLLIFQIERIREVLVGCDTELKLAVLQELSEQNPYWNTHIADIFLSGLQDQQVAVRIATFELLRLHPNRLSQPQLFQALQLIADLDRQVREVVIAEVSAFGALFKK